MSNLLIAAVISITAFVAVAYIVMAWPIFLAIIAVVAVWKAAANGRRLLQKNYIRKPNYL
jgi:glycerol-3-phosphate acyltransferase PlsY